MSDEYEGRKLRCKECSCKFLGKIGVKGKLLEAPPKVSQEDTVRMGENSDPEPATVEKKKKAKKPAKGNLEKFKTLRERKPKIIRKNKESQ